MLIHSVYFWLDKNLPAVKRAEFRKALEELKKIEGMEAVYVGEPAATTRPAVDRTYDFALTVMMRDLHAHARYQEDPKHKQFLEQYASCWIKVVIYDHE